MKKILVAAAVSALLLTGCSFKNPNSAIIKVNGDVITLSQFNKVIDKEINNSMFKAFGGSENFVKNDDNIMYLIYKEKVSKELIIKSLLDAEIAKRNITVSDEDMKNEMKSIIDKVGSKEELNSILKQRGISNNEFNEDLKVQIKMKKLIDSIEKIKISDADTLKYYNTHKKDFNREEQVRASHILISFDTLKLIRDLKGKNKNITPEKLNQELEKIQADKKAKAEAILAEVKANPDNFETIAQKESEDKVSAKRGGELGFFPKKAMVPEFANAAFSMKPNTVSESLVQSPYGYHIIKVTDRIEAGIAPYAKVKDEIKFYLETEAQMKVLKNLTDGLLKSANIEYLDESFKPENIKNNAEKASKVTLETDAKDNNKK